MNLQKKDYELEVSNTVMQQLFAMNLTSDDMKLLRYHVQQMPEAHQGEEPVHLFCNGMYCRVLHIPAGDLIFGKKHKQGHFTMLMQGRVSIVDDSGTTQMQGPTLWVSKPGVQRTIYAYSDCVLLTVHRTDSTDLSVVEEELIIGETE